MCQLQRYVAQLNSFIKNFNLRGVNKIDTKETEHNHVIATQPEILTTRVNNQIKKIGLIAIEIVILFQIVFKRKEIKNLKNTKTQRVHDIYKLDFKSQGQFLRKKPKLVTTLRFSNTTRKPSS